MHKKKEIPYKELKAGEWFSLESFLYLKLEDGWSVCLDKSKRWSIPKNTPTIPVKVNVILEDD